MIRDVEDEARRFADGCIFKGAKIEEAIDALRREWAIALREEADRILRKRAK